VNTLEATHALDDERLSLLDPVTLLPTRALFIDRCGIALARASRAKASIGLIVVSIADLEDADDTVARFDNTFVIVANDLRNARDLKIITTRLTNVLRHRGPHVSAELIDANSSPAHLLATIDSRSPRASTPAAT
jgi:GGDEF domain-containing protein